MPARLQESMPAPVRIIGLGTTFGMDQAGWRMIDALAQGTALTPFPTGFVSLRQCSDSARLAGLAVGAALVIIIDAVHAPEHEGELLRLAADDLHADRIGLSSHGHSLTDAMDLVRALDGASTRWVIFGVCGDMAATPGECDLAHCLDRTLPELTGAVISEIESML